MATERLTITIEKSKKKAFIKMLSLFDFVKVERTKDFIKKFHY